MPKEIATLFIFESESSPGKTYQTLLYVDGSTSCECPAWRFKRKVTGNGDRTCKHVRDVDCGMANRHAVKVVEYATPAAVPRIRQKAMATPMLPQRMGRRFDFAMQQEKGSQ
jgi:hypothetical protein